MKTGFMTIRRTGHRPARMQASGIPLNLVHDGKVILATQRAGSTSILKSLPEYRTVSKSWVDQYEGPRIMWIRDPWDRLASASHIFQIKDYEHWVDNQVLREDTNNAHYIPQVQLHSYQGRPLWDRVHSFDNFAETWAKEFPEVTLKHERSSPGRISAAELKTKLRPDQVESLNRYYQEDIELYEHQSKLAVL